MSTSAGRTRLPPAFSRWAAASPSRPWSARRQRSSSASTEARSGFSSAYSSSRFIRSFAAFHADVQRRDAAGEGPGADVLEAGFDKQRLQLPEPGKFVQRFRQPFVLLVFSGHPFGDEGQNVPEIKIVDRFEGLPFRLGQLQ